MARNGWKWLVIAGNGWKWPEWLKMAGMFFLMSVNGWNVLKMTDMARMAGNG